jgi:hypothetical protein
MLVQKRYEGQWLELTHRSGDVIRILARDIRGRAPGEPARVDLVCDDPARNFEIRRPEARRRAEAAAAAADDLPDPGDFAVS